MNTTILLQERMRIRLLKQFSTTGPLSPGLAGVPYKQQSMGENHVKALLSLDASATNSYIGPVR